MTEFQKWIKGKVGISWFGAEEGWKAALKWVLTQRTQSWEEDGSTSTSDIIFGRKIEEELFE